MDWVIRASRLPGRALHVGIEVWFRCGMSKSPTSAFSVSRTAKALEVGRASITRGLQALEHASLVKVDRGNGRRSLVTVLECPEDSSHEAALHNNV
jgi:hypothetical protein